MSNTLNLNLNLNFSVRLRLSAPPPDPPSPHCGLNGTRHHRRGLLVVTLERDLRADLIHRLALGTRVVNPWDSAFFM